MKTEGLGTKEVLIYGNVIAGKQPQKVNGNES